MKKVLVEMLEIYKPNGRDWMDYTLKKNNPYTYHHIVEKRNGGQCTVSNGAIITKNAHIYLNHLDVMYHRIYNELNYMFKQLNMTYQPPTDDYYEEINHILRKVK